MENGEHLSLEQVQAFLTGNDEVVFKAPHRKELYEWTQRTLCAQSYASLHRSGKGLMKRYIGKVTGLSRAQVTRLIGQYTESGMVRTRQGRGQRFTARYNQRDIALLAAVDEAHETLSGPATQKILYRLNRLEISINRLPHVGGIQSVLPSGRQNEGQIAVLLEDA